MWRRLTSQLRPLSSLRSTPQPHRFSAVVVSAAAETSSSPASLRPSVTLFSRHFSSESVTKKSAEDVTPNATDTKKSVEDVKPIETVTKKSVEDVMPIATGHEREELEAELQGKEILDINFPVGPFGTKESPAIIKSYYDKRIVGCPGGEGEDEHDVVWFWLEKGKSHECPVCTQYFELECKTIFFAGKYTTSNLMTWTTILLAMHPQWQEMARDEVLSVCGARDVPTKDHIAKLKIIGMIINESLRLYPPAVATIRRAKVDAHLGDLSIPSGTELLIPILAVHHDTTLWGSDANEFNPARFAKGVAQAAQHPMAFMPFGLGTRRCVGQNLATLEAKLAIAMILQRFSFGLSPSYRHSPTVTIMLYPQYGAPIVFQQL